MKAFDKKVTTFSTNKISYQVQDDGTHKGDDNLEIGKAVFTKTKAD